MSQEVTRAVGYVTVTFDEHRPATTSIATATRRRSDDRGAAASTDGRSATHLLADRRRERFAEVCARASARQQLDPAVGEHDQVAP